MPAGKMISKQYGALAAAGADPKRVASHTPNRRALHIQNTGVNPGSIRFENPNDPADGGDFVLVPGERLGFWTSDTCPREAVNVQSTLGTTFAFLETIVES
jgi:hypothetical protein